ncbi:MAG: C10 family peptidase [Bacteroidales bacterium]|nr:C10 family peptidase [Bacteroidales bacterium]
MIKFYHLHITSSSFLGCSHAGIFTALLILFFLRQGHSEVIDQHQASSFAVAFYSSHAPASLIARDAPSVEMIRLVEYSGMPLYYHIRMIPAGFVILAAHDNVFPILGYSFEESPDTLWNPGYQRWMERCGIQIRQAVKEKLPSSALIRDAWERYLESKPVTGHYRSRVKGVEPLMYSKWGQKTYYNALCPADPAGPGGHAYAGCVAIATAQVMFHFRHPAQGSGSHGYYSDYGFEYADFGNTSYEWNEMVTAIHQMENPAIAQLIYHVGVSVEMDYSAQGSGASTADVGYALETYFGYAPGISYIVKSDSSNAFRDSVISCLSRGLPVIYRGGDMGSGHAFVCDGFQDSCFFHFNWGWYGDHDGYYYMENLNPANHNFNFYQCAQINIRPDQPYPPNCGGISLLSAPRGTVSDGSGHLKYPSGAECRWLIGTGTDNGERVWIRFHQFDTDPVHDFVRIYDGTDETAPLLAGLSGHSIPPAVTSTGSYLCIIFETDDSCEFGGWMADYMVFSEPFCLENQVMHALECGYFDDASGPYHYMNQTHCQWVIAPSDDDIDSIASVTLYFRTFRLAEGDTLHIHDGPDPGYPVLARLTGSQVPEDITSGRNRVCLVFSSDNQSTDEGWSAGYYSNLPVYCQDTVILTQEQGYLEDGSGARNYISDSECYWLIAPSQAQSITMEFTNFDLEYGYDRLTLFDAAVEPHEELQTLTGDDLPPPISIPSGKVLLRFTTDESVVSDGWSAQYTTVGPGTGESYEEDFISIFPNPVSGTLSLHTGLDIPEGLDITLRSVDGQTAWHSRLPAITANSSLSFDLTGIQRGIYILTLSDGLMVSHQKLVVQ